MEPKHISDIAKADYWMFVLAAYRNETENFTMDINRLTDDELVLMRGVSPQFLDFAPLMFHAIHAKHHPELRRIIAYLNHLNSLQAAAWARIMPKWEAEVKATEARIKELQQLIENGSAV